MAENSIIWRLFLSWMNSMMFECLKSNLWFVEITETRILYNISSFSQNNVERFQLIQTTIIKKIFLSAFQLDSICPKYFFSSRYFFFPLLSSFFYFLFLLAFIHYHDKPIFFIDAVFLLNFLKKMMFHDVIFFEYFSVFVSNRYFKFIIPTLKMTLNTFYQKFS